MRPYEKTEIPAMLRSWAHQIDVERTGDVITIRGTNPENRLPGDLSTLFNEYLYAPNSELKSKRPTP